MACKKCGSDWVRPDGKDCKSCPHCCKQQRRKAVVEGRWTQPQVQKECVECGSAFFAVGLHNIARQIICQHPACKKSRDKKTRVESSERRANGIYARLREPKQKRFCKRHGCAKELTRREQKEYCDKACYFAAVNAGQQQFKGRVHDAWAALADWAYVWDVRRGEWPKGHDHKHYKPRPACEVCGKECKYRNSRCCSYECTKNWRGTRQCDVCAVDVPQSNLYSKCRCDTCKQRLRREANRRGKNKYGRNHRQRARHHGVAYQPVPVKAVYERDGYRCQICKRRCLKSAMFSKTDGRIHPRSPTIDHIVPMACGGNHEPGNLQTACFACNSIKGARSEGQLRMAFL